MLLFAALYTDGSVYLQTEENVSKQDPAKDAWFDIKFQPIKPLDQLVRVTLTGNGNRYSVYPQTGEFEFNGAKVSVGLPPAGGWRPVNSRVCASAGGEGEVLFHRFGLEADNGKRHVVEIRP